MKTIILLMALGLPFVCFAQPGKKAALTDYYENLNYSLVYSTNFTLSQGEEKYVDKDFASYNDFIVCLVPAYDGVYNSKLYIDNLDNGEVVIYAVDGTSPARVVKVTTKGTDCNLRLSGRNASAYYSTLDYDFCIMVFARKY